MKKTKSELLEFFCKLYVTLQIYLELYNANWIMKFKPQKVQDLIQTMALELHKSITPINWDKFCKITSRLSYFLCKNYTLDVFHLSFFCTWNFDVLLFSTLL